MTNTSANDQWIQYRAAMLGIVFGSVVESLTGSGIAHQIGLGALVHRYAACRTQVLPFCFCDLGLLPPLIPYPLGLGPKGLVLAADTRDGWHLIQSDSPLRDCRI
jgi:hypothetical protein